MIMREEKTAAELNSAALTGRVLYLDFLRVISMLSVIVLHTAAYYWYTEDVRSFAWNAFNFYDSVVRWGVPVFTMISGALFLSPSKNITIQDLYSKYILRIVLAFIVWSCLYAAFHLFLTGGGIKGFLKDAIAGEYHMWFLYMLAGLYIIVPLLRRITDNKDATKYFLILSFLFSFVIPAVLLALQLYDAELYDFANGVYGKVYFHFALGYSFYFVLGYYLSVTTMNRKKEILCYVLGLAGFISTVLLSKGISYYMNEPNRTFYNEMSINVMLESVSVFVFAKYRVSRLIQSGKGCNIIRKLSKLSFGVYLIHAFFLDLLSIFGLDTLTFNPALSVPVIVFIVFLLSLGASAILNKIPIVKKYLV